MIPASAGTSTTATSAVMTTEMALPTPKTATSNITSFMAVPMTANVKSATPNVNVLHIGSAIGRRRRSASVERIANDRDSANDCLNPNSNDIGKYNGNYNGIAKDSGNLKNYLKRNTNNTGEYNGNYSNCHKCSTNIIGDVSSSAYDDGNYYSEKHTTIIISGDVNYIECDRSNANSNATSTALAAK
ncbi:hypothetical protein Aperf_G00000057392 [Anoplocephala perfoliata]